MRKALALSLVAVALLSMAAGRPHKPKPQDLAVGSIALAPGSDARYQGLISFEVTGTEGLNNPRIWVECYQDGVRVYGEGGSPSFTWKLGGDMSDWVLNGGGPADCTARLYWITNADGTGEWNGNGDQGGTVTLGETTFHAEG